MSLVLCCHCHWRPGKSFQEWTTDSAPAGRWSAPASGQNVLSLPIAKVLPPPPKTEWNTRPSRRRKGGCVRRHPERRTSAKLVSIHFPRTAANRTCPTTHRKPPRSCACEVSELALGDDAELAGTALRCSPELPAPTVKFAAPVEAVGRDIANVSANSTARPWKPTRVTKVRRMSRSGSAVDGIRAHVAREMQWRFHSGAENHSGTLTSPHRQPRHAGGCLPRGELLSASMGWHRAVTHRPQATLES